MNKQRKVLITITYNEMGIIIDTKAEEVAQPNLQPTCNQLATDTISRQMATDALRKMQTYKMFEGDDVLLIDQAGAMTELMLLPPAQPKRGKWMLDRSGAYCCSECMEPCATYVMMKPRDKFCKMCGAKMEVNNESD